MTRKINWPGAQGAMIQSASVQSLTLHALSCFLRVMRIIAALFLVLFSTQAIARPISGFVSVEGSQTYFIEHGTTPKYAIKPNKLEVIESLKKLGSFDFFQGQGELINGELLLDSIDFVGLRSLIGLWSVDRQSLFDFQDFQKVIIYKSFFNLMTPRAQLHYSIAPSAGTDWKIFFTDENSVILASLILSNDHATLRFYDLENGEVYKKVELTKIPKRN